MSNEQLSCSRSAPALVALLLAVRDAGLAGNYPFVILANQIALLQNDCRSHAKTCEYSTSGTLNNARLSPCDCPPSAVALALLFTSFAPHILSVEQVRAMRSEPQCDDGRITSKLAKSLSTFVEQSATASNSVPPNLEDKQHSSGDLRAGSDDSDDNSEDLMTVTADTASFLREIASDMITTHSSPQLDSPLTRLGEIVLCAGLHSPARDAFVAAIMSLPAQYQDVLAVAINDLQVHPNETFHDASDTPSTPHQLVLRSDHLNDENYSSDNDSSRLSQRKSDSDLSISQRSVLGENSSLANIQHRSGSGKNFAGAAVASQTTIAVKQESAELRERVLALEQELREKSAQVASMTAQATATRQAAIAAQGDTLGVDGIPRTRAAEYSPDLEELRAKASTVEQLEANLKRASARLEQFGDAKRRIAELEKENAGIRDSELRGQARILVLEARLDTSKSRIESLVSAERKIANELAGKCQELTSANDENMKINQQLHAAKSQLASFLTAGSQQGQEEEEGDDSTAARSAPLHATDSHVLPSSSPQVVRFNSGAAVAAMRSELGITMSWNDIVECVRGVMDAMREMDEAEAARESQIHVSPENIQRRLFLKRPRDSSPADEYITQSYSARQATDSNSNSSARHEAELQDSSDLALPFVAETEQQAPPQIPQGQLVVDEGDSPEKLDSEQEKRTKYFPRVRTLQEFMDVNMHMEAQSHSADDDLDFVADQINVPEMNFDDASGTGHRPPSSSRSSSTTTLPRRRSSVPSLPTVPEEYEGFVEHGMSASSDSGDDKSCASLCGADDHHVTSEQTHESYNAVAQDHSESDGPGHEQGVEYAVISPPVSGAMTPQIEASSPRRPTSPGQSPLMSPVINPRKQAVTETGEAISMANDVGGPSMGLLIRQLSESRDELCHYQSVANSKERECAELRQELALLIKEVDSLMAHRNVLEQHEKAMLLEKERLIKHLDESLHVQTAELNAAKDEIHTIREELTQLRREKSAITDELRIANKKLAEALRQQEVASRSHEIEVAKLTAQLESSELLADKLGECVSQPNLRAEFEVEPRHGYYAELLETVRRERSMAAAAREESRQAALRQSQQLAEIHAAARAAAEARQSTANMGTSKLSKGNRFARFLRRVARRDVHMRSSGVIPRDEVRPATSTIARSSSFST